MRPSLPRSSARLTGFAVFLVLTLCGANSLQRGDALAARSGHERPDEILARIFAEVPPGLAPSGILYDRVLPLSDISELRGGAYTPTISLRRWQQAYFEIRRASGEAGRLPALEELRARSKQRMRAEGSAHPGSRLERVPIAVLDYEYDRIREELLAKESTAVSAGKLELDRSDLRADRVFSAAPWKEYSYHGEELEFELPPEWQFRNQPSAPRSWFLDADDGRGYRELDPQGRLRVKYNRVGGKTLRLAAVYADGTVRNAHFGFEVRALAVPAPDDTLELTASIAHEGTSSSGEAYLYYAPGRSALEQPLLLIEGFDLDDSLNWDEIYTLLNTENLLEDLRSAGYDIVVLNFEDATTDIQRNSYLVVELIQQVQQLIDPRAHFTVAGASMGGLCSRYALVYMEQNALPHRVNTWISFDAPHGGANIPLGLQYWLEFFSGESADADFLLSRLDRPAARQLLVYHHLAPDGQSDPLRAEFQTQLDALGGYPISSRRVAIANGSGTQMNQGFAAGAKLLQWHFDNVLTQITGDVWAVGDGPNTHIFEGAIGVLYLPVSEQDVYVAGTQPFDSAPGGSRASLAQADSTEAPYGDILALHGRHCFIPTVSALGSSTADLFYDLAGSMDPASLSPFDAVYFPAENQEHVLVTAENAQWIKEEIFGSPTASDPAPSFQNRTLLYQNVPNPFNPATTIRFRLATAEPVRLEIFDLRGRRVATLVDQVMEGGDHRLVWNGRDATGTSVGSGVYFVRLSTRERTDQRRMVLVR